MVRYMDVDGYQEWFDEFAIVRDRLFDLFDLIEYEDLARPKPDMGNVTALPFSRERRHVDPKDSIRGAVLNSEPMFFLQNYLDALWKRGMPRERGNWLHASADYFKGKGISAERACLNVAYRGAKPPDIRGDNHSEVLFRRRFQRGLAALRAGADVERAAELANELSMFNEDGPKVVPFGPGREPSNG